MTRSAPNHCPLTANFNKMQFINAASNGTGNPWGVLPSAGMMPTDVLASASALLADQASLREMKAQISNLVEMSLRQAEKNEAMMQQLNEQAKYMCATTQGVRQLQSQVNAMRNELIDVCRGTCDPRNLDDQVRSKIEARRGDFSAPSVAAPLGGAQGGSLNNSEVSSHEGDTCNASRGPAVAAPSPVAIAAASSPATAAIPTTAPPSATIALAEFLPEKAPGTPPRTPPKTPPEDHREATPSSFARSSFNRSPPGLSLWAEGLDDPLHPARVLQQQRIPAREKEEDVIAEMTALFNLVTSSETEICIQAVSHTRSTVINKADQDGMTALHYAAMHGHADVCLAILKHPCFKSTKVGDRNNSTAMHIAALHDRGDVCQVILAHDPTAASAVNRFGDRPVDIAIRRGDASVCAAFERCSSTDL